MASSTANTSSSGEKKSIKDVFNEKLRYIAEHCNERSDYFTTERYNRIISEVQEAKRLKANKLQLSSKYYRRLRRFDVITVDGKEKLIQRGAGDKFRYYCTIEEFFDIIEATHLATGHRRIRTMETEINKKYCNVTRVALEHFLSLCEECPWKVNSRKRVLCVEPIVLDHMNSRCQVNLIDMQAGSDREYRFILNYQDLITRFIMLKPLRTKTAEEVAFNLIDIFCILGVPFILQSDDEREFANQIIKSLAKMWPGLKLVHGKPQGSVENLNQKIKDMLALWMVDNNTKQWSEGLRFVQSKKNRSFHGALSKTPHEAMFGSKQKIGLADSALEARAFTELESEEDLEKILTKITEEEGNQNADKLVKSPITIDQKVLEVDRIKLESANMLDESGMDQMDIKEEILEETCDRGEKVAEVKKVKLEPTGLLDEVLKVSNKPGIKGKIQEETYDQGVSASANPNFIDSLEIASASLSSNEVSEIPVASKFKMP